MSEFDALPPPPSTPIPSPPGFDDEEIPVIGAGMLDHGPPVDFEARMPALPRVSALIALACLAAFGFELARDALTDLDRLVAVGALVPERVRDGEVWRLLSAVFLHGSLDHLIGNLLMLYVLGMACEHGFGGPQFLILYVGAGLTGALMSMTGDQPSVGASGAIFGLAGALIVLFARYRHRLHLRDRRIGLVLAIWACYQLGLGLLNPAIDNRAHLGGLLGGAALGFLLRPAVLEGREAVRRRPLAIAGLAVTLMALALTAAAFVPRLWGG